MQLLIRHQVFDCLLRLLSSPTVARRLENDPTAQNRLLTAVQTVAYSASLGTPAPTPASTSWLSEEASPSDNRHTASGDAAARCVTDETRRATADGGKLLDGRSHKALVEQDPPVIHERSLSPERQPGRERRRRAQNLLKAPDFGDQRFAQLAPRLRAGVWDMTTEGLRNAKHFFSTKREPFESNLVSLTDPRPKQLRHYIENWIRWEKSLASSAIVCRISKRIHLVELAALKGQMEGSPEAVNNKLTDILFPELVVFQRSTKRTSGGSKDRPYAQAKRKLEYWIRLGMLLLRLVERYGYGVLLLLPESMTDTA